MSQILPLAGIFERCIKNSHTRSNPLTVQKVLPDVEEMSGIRTTDVDIFLSSCYSIKYVHTKIGQTRVVRLK